MGLSLVTVANHPKSAIPPAFRGASQVMSYPETNDASVLTPTSESLRGRSYKVSMRPSSGFSSAVALTTTTDIVQRVALLNVAELDKSFLLHRGMAWAPGNASFMNVTTP